MNEAQKLRSKLGTAEKFIDFLNTLCLTDRQRAIANYKFLRGWVAVDIAEELGISRKTVNSEIKVIREIMMKSYPDFKE